MIIYIAGPYQSHSANGVFENIIKARAVACELWHKGYAVICPHMNTAFMDGDGTDDLFLDGDLEIMSFCDAVLRLPGESIGADIEVNQAREWCIPVYFSIAELEKDEKVSEMWNMDDAGFTSCRW